MRLPVFSTAVGESTSMKGAAAFSLRAMLSIAPLMADFISTTGRPTWFGIISLRLGGTNRSNEVALNRISASVSKLTSSTSILEHCWLVSGQEQIFKWIGTFILTHG